MKLIGVITLWLVALLVFQLLSILSLAIQIPRKLYRGEPLSDYFLTLAIGEDQRGGSYLYGTEDWTISSFTYLLASREVKFAASFMWLIDFLPRLFKLQENHCEESYLKEKQELNNGGAKHHKEDKK